jgi:hypothetical protein
MNAPERPGQAVRGIHFPNRIASLSAIRLEGIGSSISVPTHRPLRWTHQEIFPEPTRDAVVRQRGPVTHLPGPES